MRWLADQDERLAERAGRQRLPETLLARWPARLERSERFAEAARSALDDGSLTGHWDSRPEARDAIDGGFRAAERRHRLPEIEEGRIAGMVRAETARLRDSRIDHSFARRWRGGEALVAGDRLRLRRWRGAEHSEAVVRSSGWTGGRNPRDMVQLEWLAAGRGHEVQEAVEAIPARMLTGMNVRLAAWSHAGLREAALARERSQRSDAFPVECLHDDLAVGDLLSWTELVDPALAEGRPLDRAEPMEAVRFEGELVRRTAEEKRLEDRCTVNVTWRSDGRPCGERRLSLAALTGRGCWRTLWQQESRRRSSLRVQTLELRMSRRLLLDPGLHLSMKP